MKILVLSDAVWNENNCFGNTFSNIFGNVENIEIAHICCAAGIPGNNIVKHCFQITESLLIGNFLNKNKVPGREIEHLCDNDKIEQSTYINKLTIFAKKHRAMIFFWIRNLIWKLGNWKSGTLIKFIDNFAPDILFLSLSYSGYLNDIVQFVKQHTNKPMVGYVSDDIYTLRQFSLSPLYWINRLYIRDKVKKMVEQCTYLYVISDIQKEEYKKCFNKECKILWKGAKFENKLSSHFVGYPLKLVYTGNIGVGRYKQLALIGQALCNLNQAGIRAKLDIYTMTPMTRKMKKALDIPGAVNVKGGISPAEVIKVQDDADILVHVESFDLKSRLAVHQSFSTKIVDYFAKGKCIFASGPRDVASIDYLIRNDAAVVATNKYEIVTKLKMLVDNKELIFEYGDKAWECGKRNHQIKDIQDMLYNDLEEIVNDVYSRS